MNLTLPPIYNFVSAAKIAGKIESVGLAHVQNITHFRIIFHAIFQYLSVHESGNDGKKNALWNVSFTSKSNGQQPSDLVIQQNWKPHE